MRNPLAPGFHWSVDNFQNAYATSTFGVTVTQSATANVKGADVEVMSDASVTEDVYGIAIGLMASNNAASIRNYLVDVKTDPTGGTTYATIIPNLIFNSSSGTTGGLWYYFPLFIKAGTAIAMASQCNVGNGTANSIPRLGIRLFGKPVHPELLKYGSFVRAFGANTAASNGTAVTPGTSTMGAYTASLGTTAEDLWWWQAGYNSGDTTQSDTAMWLDLAAGDATNKVLCVHHAVYITRAAETAGGGCMGLVPPYMPIASGANVYIRMAASATPDATITVVGYGLGG